MELTDLNEETRFRQPAMIVPIRRCPLRPDDDMKFRSWYDRQLPTEANAVQKYLHLRTLVLEKVSSYV